MITPIRIIFGIICGILCGAVFFVEVVHIFADRNAPIVTGCIVAREPIRQFSVPRADLTIQIDGSEKKVHAHTQRYLMTKIPEVVRFHYSGNPAQEVFLFENEENPYWIVLTCWGISLFLFIFLVASHRSAHIRKILGWSDIVPH